jgi:hypothetical protein
MRNPETIESLRLRETIADFQSKINSLGFQKPQHKEFRETSASEVQKFLENKVGQQNQEYLQKASQNPGAPHQTPSDLFGYKSEDKATQINNLLDQAIHNKGGGSFESRNASAFEMAISKLGKALSLTSMSSGGDHPQQKKSSLQRSQSLPTSQKPQSTQQLQSDKKTPSLTNRKKLKKPESKKIKPLIRKKTWGKILSDLFTFKKTETETQIYGTSRGSAKPIKAKAVQPSSTASLSRNSNFTSSRIGPISRSHQNSNSSTRSQSFNNGLRSQQSIAGRNQNLSRSDNARNSQDSFSPQNSRGSHASKVIQSRGEGNRNAPKR